MQMNPVIAAIVAMYLLVAIVQQINEQAGASWLSSILAQL